MRLQPMINWNWCISSIPLFSERFKEQEKNSRSIFSETTQNCWSFPTESKTTSSPWGSHQLSATFSFPCGVWSRCHQMKKEYVGPASGVLCLVPKAGQVTMSLFLNFSPTSSSQLPPDTVSFFLVFISALPTLYLNHKKSF